MSDWQIVRHRVAIAGRVLDGATGKPVAGAVVSMTAMPSAFQERLATGFSTRDDGDRVRLDGTCTRRDGLFYFLDLPDGKYTLGAAMPTMSSRYGAAQASSHVSRDGQGSLKTSFVTLTLLRTVVKGKIVGSAHKNGVAMAEVRVKGSGEHTYSDAQGQYAVAGIEAGKRVLLVSAQGYQRATQNVTLAEPGIAKTVDFSLTRESG